MPSRRALLLLALSALVIFDSRQPVPALADFRRACSARNAHT